MTKNGIDETIFFYGQNGEKLATIRPNHNSISTVTENVYFAGQLWLQGMAPQVGTNLLKVDRLGSVRGSYFGNSVPSATYLPFGDELSVTSNDREKFGTYTRDSSTGFDYANQRFYNSTNGFSRFMTADPYRNSGGPADPGSWNKYSYVEGDPVNHRDPRGLFSCGDDSDYEANVCDEEEPVYYYHYDPGDQSGTTTGGGGTAFPTLRGNASKFVNAFNKGLLNAISRLQKNKDCDSLGEADGHVGGQFAFVASESGYDGLNEPDLLGKLDLGEAAFLPDAIQTFLPETCVQTSTFASPAYVRPTTWLSSTLSLGCHLLCSTTASPKLVQRFYASNYGRFLLRTRTRPVRV